MRITERTLAERKKRILYDSYDLFCKYGIDAVSISQISKKSNISVNSIYSYFDSKATLVRHTQKILWEEIVDHILSGSARRLETCQNGLDEIAVLLFNFKDFYENHSSYLLFACDYNLFLVRNHIKQSQQYYEEIHRPVYKAFCAALERGHRDGSITKSQEVTTQFLMVWGIMHGFVERLVVFDEMYEGVNPYKEHFDLLIEGTLQRLKCEQ